MKVDLDLQEEDLQVVIEALEHLADSLQDTSRHSRSVVARSLAQDLRGFLPDPDRWN